MSRLLIFLGALSRLLPHPANFTPITAMALFGGSHLPKRQAILIPFLAMIISDVGLYFTRGYPLVSGDTLFVYLSLAAISGIGIWLGKNRTFSRFVWAAVSSIALFFIVTNFGTWLTSGLYPRTVEGILSCYIAAIPFLRNSLLGDIVWMTAFFGSFAAWNLGRQGLTALLKKDSENTVGARKS